MNILRSKEASTSSVLAIVVHEVGDALFTRGVGCPLREITCCQLSLSSQRRTDVRLKSRYLSSGINIRIFQDSQVSTCVAKVGAGSLGNSG